MSTLVVTGGSRGIGSSICVEAARAGWDVVVNYVSNAGAAEELVAAIERAGGQAISVKADVSVEADVFKLFKAAAAWRGPVTGLVNNAGISGGFARVEAVTGDTLRAVMGVNVVGPFLCAREAVLHMSTKHGGTGGAIVNMTSRAAVLGSAGEWVHYAASKGALNTMTVGLANEVATEGIRVNAVAVGLVDTEMHAAAGDPGRPDRMRPTVPMQRSGTPEEVAAAVLWLLSDAASYTTGTILAVSGGC
jgi:NAD(P)-dependent dehydrogenase (short-subunit alcohol dehydrogenase family)